MVWGVVGNWGIFKKGGWRGIGSGERRDLKGWNEFKGGCWRGVRR